MPQNSNCPRESSLHTLVFQNKALLKCSIITGLSMEKIHLHIMLSNVSQINFHRLVVFFQKKRVRRLKTSQENVDKIQEAFIQKSLFAVRNTTNDCLKGCSQPPSPPCYSSCLEDNQPFVMFQQDCSLPHQAYIVQEYFYIHFPSTGFGHNGPIPWPPHSLYIMLLDFFLWGYVKDVVCKISVAELLL